jgi:Protein of unknown function (DUF4239)
MSTHSILHTVKAVVPPVLFSIVLADAGCLLVRYLVDADLLRPDLDVVGNYLQTLGTIYAVLLAFVVFVVWGQFNDARLNVEREANELLDLYRTTKGFPLADRRKIHGLLRRYVDAVLDKEWDAMACGDDRAIDEDWAIVDAVWDALHGFEPGSESCKAIYCEVLARFNDLSDTRTNRLSSSRLRIPRALKFLLYTGAVLTTGSMFLFAVDNLAVHLIITGAMSGAIAHVLYIIWDLDNAFHGDWQVPREPFLRVQRYMENFEPTTPAPSPAARPA